LLVLEGQLNPAFDTPDDRRLQAQLDATLRKGAAEQGYIYLSVADQNVTHPEIDWKDPAHLNEKGREKLTTFLLDYYRRNQLILNELNFKIKAN